MLANFINKSKKLYNDNKNSSNTTISNNITNTTGYKGNVTYTSDDINSDNIQMLTFKLVPIFPDFRADNKYLRRTFTRDSLIKVLNFINRKYDYLINDSENYVTGDATKSYANMCRQISSTIYFDKLIKELTGDKGWDELGIENVNPILNKNEYFMQSVENKKEPNLDLKDTIPATNYDYIKELQAKDREETHNDISQKKDTKIIILKEPEEIPVVTKKFKEQDIIPEDVEPYYDRALNDMEDMYNYSDEEEGYKKERELKATEKTFKDIQEYADTTIKNKYGTSLNMKINNEYRQIIIKKIQALKAESVPFEKYLSDTGYQLSQNELTQRFGSCIMDTRKLDLGLYQYTVDSTVLCDVDFTNFSVIKGVHNNPNAVIYVPTIWMKYREENPNISKIKRGFQIVDEDDISYRIRLTGKEVEITKQIIEALNSEDLVSYTWKAASQVKTRLDNKEEVNLFLQTDNILVTNRNLFANHNKNLSTLTNYLHTSDFTTRVRQLSTKVKLPKIPDGLLNHQVREINDYDLSFLPYYLFDASKSLTYISGMHAVEGVLIYDARTATVEEIVESFPKYSPMAYNDGLIKYIEVYSNNTGNNQLMDEIKMYLQENVGGTYSPVTSLYRFHTVLLEHYRSLYSDKEPNIRDVNLEDIYSFFVDKEGYDSLNRRYITEPLDSMYYRSVNAEFIEAYYQWYYIGDTNLYSNGMSIDKLLDEQYTIQGKVITPLTVNGTSKGFPTMKLKRKQTLAFELFSAAENFSYDLSKDMTSSYYWLKCKKDVQNAASTPRNFTPKFSSFTIQLQAICNIEKSLHRSWKQTGNMMNFSVLSEDFDYLVRSILTLKVNEYVIYNFCDNVYTAQRLENGKIVYVSLDIIKSESHISLWHYNFMYHLYSKVHNLAENTKVGEYFKSMMLHLGNSKVVYTDGSRAFVADNPLLPSGSDLTSASNNHSTGIFIFEFRQTGFLPFNQDGKLSQQFHDIASSVRIKFSDDFLMVEDFANFFTNDKVEEYAKFQYMDMLGYDCVQISGIYVPILNRKRWVKSICFDKSFVKKEDFDDIMRLKALSLLGHSYKDRSIVVAYLEKRIRNLQIHLKKRMDKDQLSDRVDRIQNMFYESVDETTVNDLDINNVMEKVYGLIIPGTMDMIRLIHKSSKATVQFADIIEEKNFFGLCHMESPNAARIQQLLRTIYGDKLLVEFDLDEFKYKKKYVEGDYLNIIKTRNNQLKQFNNMSLFISKENIIQKIITSKNLEFDIGRDDLFRKRNLILKYLYTVNRAYNFYNNMREDNISNLTDRISDLPTFIFTPKNLGVKLKYSRIEDYGIFSKPKLDSVSLNDKLDYVDHYNKFISGVQSYLRFVRSKEPDNNHIIGFPNISKYEFYALILQNLRNVDGHLLLWNYGSIKDLVNNSMIEKSSIRIEVMKMKRLQPDALTLLKDLIKLVHPAVNISIADHLEIASADLYEDPDQNNIYEPSNGYAAMDNDYIGVQLDKNIELTMINIFKSSPFLVERYLAYVSEKKGIPINVDSKYVYGNNRLKGIYMFNMNINEYKYIQSYPKISFSVKPLYNIEKEGALYKTLPIITHNLILGTRENISNKSKRNYTLNDIRRLVAEYRNVPVSEIAIYNDIDMLSLFKYYDNDYTKNDVEVILNFMKLYNFSYLIEYLNKVNTKIHSVDWEKHILETTEEDYRGSKIYRSNYLDVSFSTEYLKRKYNRLKLKHKKKEEDKKEIRRKMEEGRVMACMSVNKNKECVENKKREKDLKDIGHKINCYYGYNQGRYFRFREVRYSGEPSADNTFFVKIACDSNGMYIDGRKEVYYLDDDEVLPFKTIILNEGMVYEYKISNPNSNSDDYSFDNKEYETELNISEIILDSDYYYRLNTGLYIRYRQIKSPQGYDIEMRLSETDEYGRFNDCQSSIVKLGTMAYLTSKEYKFKDDEFIVQRLPIGIHNKKIDMLINKPQNKIEKTGVLKYIKDNNGAEKLSVIFNDEGYNQYSGYYFYNKFNNKFFTFRLIEFIYEKDYGPLDVLVECDHNGRFIDGYNDYYFHEGTILDVPFNITHSESKGYEPIPYDKIKNKKNFNETTVIKEDVLNDAFICDVTIDKYEMHEKEDIITEARLNDNKIEEINKIDEQVVTPYVRNKVKASLKLDSKGMNKDLFNIDKSRLIGQYKIENIYIDNSSLQDSGSSYIDNRGLLQIITLFDVDKVTVNKRTKYYIVGSFLKFIIDNKMSNYWNKYYGDIFTLLVEDFDDYKDTSIKNKITGVLNTKLINRKYDIVYEVDNNFLNSSNKISKMFSFCVKGRSVIDKKTSTMGLCFSYFSNDGIVLKFVTTKNIKDSVATLDIYDQGVVLKMNNLQCLISLNQDNNIFDGKEQYDIDISCNSLVYYNLTVRAGKLIDQDLYFEKIEFIIGNKIEKEDRSINDIVKEYKLIKSEYCGTGGSIGLSNIIGETIIDKALKSTFGIKRMNRIRLLNLDSYILV